MYKLIASVLLVALLLVVPAGANTVTLTFTGLGPGSAGGPNSSGGYSVYPYYFTVGGTTGVPLLCDDMGNTITQGESWSATVHTFSNLSGTLFSNLSNYVTLYKEAGWLFLQLGSNPSASKAAAINWAIWGLFTPSVVNTSAYKNSGAAAWITQVDGVNFNSLPSNYFDNLVIYTPTAGSNAQEMIGGGPVPEPATIALIGSGLLALGGYMRKFRLSRNANVIRD